MIQRLFCWLGWHDRESVVVSGRSGQAVRVVSCRECGTEIERGDKEAANRRRKIHDPRKEVS